MKALTESMIKSVTAGERGKLFRLLRRGEGEEVETRGPPPPSDSLSPSGSATGDTRLPNYFVLSSG